MPQQLPGDLRYAAALSQQQEQEPQTISDAARQLVLRNLDAAFGQGEWDPDDLKQLQSILYVLDNVGRVTRHRLVNQIIKIHNDHNPEERVWPVPPNPERAHIEDDPEELKWRIRYRKSKKVIAFDDRRAYQLWVLRNLFVPESDHYTEKEKAEITKAVAELEKPSPYEQPEPDEPFDPTAFSDYDISPRARKILRPYEIGKHDWWIGYAITDGPPSLTLANRNSRPTKLTFKSIKQLDDYIVAHADDFARWGEQQRANVKPDAKKEIKRIVQETLKLYRAAIQQGEKADLEEFQRAKSEIRDDLDYLVHANDTPEMNKLRDFMNITALFHIGRPSQPWAIEEFHLEWLPEQVKRIMSGEIS